MNAFFNTLFGIISFPLQYFSEKKRSEELRQFAESLNLSFVEKARKETEPQLDEFILYFQGNIKEIYMQD